MLAESLYRARISPTHSLSLFKSPGGPSSPTYLQYEPRPPICRSAPTMHLHTIHKSSYYRRRKTSYQRREEDSFIGSGVGPIVICALSIIMLLITSGFLYYLYRKRCPNYGLQKRVRSLFKRNRKPDVEEGRSNELSRPLPLQHGQPSPSPCMTYMRVHDHPAALEPAKLAVKPSMSHLHSPHGRVSAMRQSR